MRSCLSCLAAGLLLIAAAGVRADTGFLVAAPDRGFTGNTEIRDAFAPFTENRVAELVFVTDKRAGPYFERAVARLEEAGADRIVVLPFYLSAADPDFDLIGAFMDAVEGVDIQLGRPYGRSYLAARALADRLENVPHDASKVVVIATGGEDAERNDRIANDLRHLADAAAERFHFDEITAVVLGEDDDMEERLAELDTGSVAVPFHLGAKYSGMMAYTAWLQYSAPDDMNVLDGDVTPHDSVTLWMQREAGRYHQPENSEVGVVVHAHGSDFHWNETMRQAAAPLAEDYMIEYGFSMGHPATLERAVTDLEKRGAKAVVIVRIFGMSNSFLSGIEGFIGSDYERCEVKDGQGGHGMHGGTAPRLLTSVPVSTAGGLEDHPLFARALLERARDLSEDPGRETVILVAHGKGSDEGNDQWLDLLNSIRRTMLAEGGDEFRAIEVGTWREDWPDKREAAIGRIREFVEKANEDNGRALIIPARTTEQGPARDLLPDMDFELGEGFAPHPLFVEWLREQVKIGIDQIYYDEPEAWRCEWN